ncbi:hypothetical protein PLEOSDRAFT_1087141 [Pleurotus ostreatus PC15]|uniref:Uncharacterized protein n=1 Tax=Pleurotus ostreatus (strain PC15) TaxID=1137138 RepID=A0A067N3U2_PLEO1|nr:hypothetical protein PLEOSDRAFT_1087134 [Pleurotus ostreatus PC15]KDQ22533.1 hypothetical protein PLEOSDRAFT_1087141 [Pleurotus ostreatus PC15]
MSTNAPTKSSLDVAVESACKMFLSMRNLVKVRTDSIAGMNGARGVDGLREQLDLLETITDATLRTIRDLRAPRAWEYIDDAAELSYCKRQAVDYDGVETRGASNNSDEALLAAETLVACGIHEERLAHISGMLSDGRKCTVETVWLNVHKECAEEHQIEEDRAFSRLLSGYDSPRSGYVEEYFEEFVDSSATFKQQMDWDKDTDALDIDKRIARREGLIDHVRGTHAARDLVHNILATVFHLKLAVDWNSKPPAWKDNYMEAKFVEAYSDRVDKMRLGISTRDFDMWFAGERRKFKDRQQDIITARNWTLALYKEFGSAVLLDPRWNPSRFGKGSRSQSFATFLPYLMANLPMRRAMSDELISGGGGKDSVRFIGGRGMVKYNAGTQSDNDVLVLTLLKYISKRNEIVAYVEAFIAKMRKVECNHVVFIVFDERARSRGLNTVGGRRVDMSTGGCADVGNAWGRLSASFSIRPGGPNAEHVAHSYANWAFNSSRISAYTTASDNTPTP